MARGTVNKVIILGRLGQDPETRNTASGTLVVNLNVATNEIGPQDQNGNRQDVTEWHRIVLFGRTAEVAAQYLSKGSSVYIEGRLQTRKWQDQNGQDRYSTEIVGNEMQLLGGQGQNGGGQPQGQGGYQQPQGGGFQQPQGGFQQPQGGYQQQQPPVTQNAGGGFQGGPNSQPQGGFNQQLPDDDIPF